jgi:hypothetical protein
VLVGPAVGIIPRVDFGGHGDLTHTGAEPGVRLTAEQIAGAGPAYDPACYSPHAVDPMFREASGGGSYSPMSLARLVVKRAVKSSLGIKAGGIPVNTLCAMPALASPSLSKSPWVLTGIRDTLYTVGVLDLGKGPEILHVPDMAGRYYSIEFVDPWFDVFADVGRRTTGTRAGDYLISGPHWKGAAPEGATKIVSPKNSVLLIGRVLVEGDGDLSTAVNLAKQIQVVPVTIRQPGQ